jgi:DNA-binding CsgD family transcriptional regulator
MAPPTLPPLPLSAEQWTRIAKQLALSPQQKRIAELILRHQCDKQIAAILEIALPTVRTHISRIFARLKVSDREQLILLVFRLAQGESTAVTCHREG